ncbi:MAG: transporter substrate-binding domain-containing protein [Cyanobacteriota bacterium]|nr:transporter substrate-binding domain-containing protein [Cyanobacteriota bacterium]
MNSPFQPSELPQERWLDIENRQQLLIGLCPDLPGMGCWNAERGTFEGFEPELARCLTQELMGVVDRATWSPVTPGERIPRVVQGDLDMVLSQLTITPERLEIVDFSDPYLVAYEAVLVAESSPIQNLEDLRGKTVAVAEDTASFHRYTKLHPEIHLVTTAKESDGIHLLLAGTVDGVANDNVNLEGLLATMPKADVAALKKIDVSSSFDPKPFGVCLRKGSPIFLSKLNQAIAKLKANGTIDQLFRASRQF